MMISAKNVDNVRNGMDRMDGMECTEWNGSKDGFILLLVVFPTIVLHTASRILYLLLFPSSSETDAQPTTENYCYFRSWYTHNMHFGFQNQSLQKYEDLTKWTFA